MGDKPIKVANFDQFHIEKDDIEQEGAGERA